MGSEWVFEYMCQVLQSPSWEVPVMTFIDETCAIFDNEEENKLTHMEAHSDFKVLVERLLTQHLTEVGISSEEFYEACEVAYRRKENGDFATKIIQQLIACDDFLTFKTIMFKRNKELELEALMSLAEGLDDEDSDAEDDVDLALRDSARESKEQDALVRQETEDLEAAIALSKDAERMKEVSLLEQEQADLEAAIAVSIAMEEERLRQLEDSSSHESKSCDNESKECKESDESKESGSSRGSKLPPLGNASIAAQREMLDEGKRAAARVMSSMGASSRSVNPRAADFDEVDVARRRRHLEAQRKKLLAKKQRERERELRDFQASKNPDQAPSSPGGPKKPAMQTRITSEQGQLTHALARRMKQDLLEGADGNDETGFGSLDAKLRQVEQLRRERANLLRGGI